MNTKLFVAFTSLALLLAGGLFAKSQRRDLSETVIEASRISGGEGEPSLHYLLGAGGNLCFFVGEKGTLLVDSQFEVLGEKIRAALKEISADKPQYLVNTHWHGDHTGGN
ncbi:MAG: MBL fold metallo-hydrolase, partial [Planctomycetota bacterium]